MESGRVSLTHIALDNLPGEVAFLLEEIRDRDERINGMSNDIYPWPRIQRLPYSRLSCLKDGHHTHYDLWAPYTTAVITI